MVCFPECKVVPFEEVVQTGDSVDLRRKSRDDGYSWQRTTIKYLGGGSRCTG